MKLDPADIFSSAMSGVMTRGVLAWLAVWLGLVGAEGMAAVGVVSFLMLPFVILGHVVASGGAILLTLPLAAILAYAALEFIRDEGSWRGLGILTLLSLVVCLPAAGDVSLPGVMIVVGGSLMFAAHLRKSKEESDSST